MTQHNVELNWKNNWIFDATQQERHLRVGSSDIPGQTVEAFSPKQLLLVSLAGCTGVDMANLLPKMRVPFTAIAVSATGTLAEEAPKIYTRIHIVYRITAAEEHRGEIERAIDLSTTKYCGVHAMLEKAADITHELIIE